MEKIFGGTKERINKVIIVIIFIFMFNFLFTNLGNSIVFATEKGEVLTDEEMMETEGGGEFLLPIHALVLFLADAVLEVMQNNFISSQPVTITATSEDMEEVNGWAIFGMIVGAIVFAGACVVTCRSSCSSGWSCERWNCCCRFDVSCGRRYFSRRNSGRSWGGRSCCNVYK